MRMLRPGLAAGRRCAPAPPSRAPRRRRRPRPPAPPARPRRRPGRTPSARAAGGCRAPPPARGSTGCAGAASGPRRRPACPSRVTPNRLSSCAHVGSVSRSSQVKSTRFLARKSRTRKRVLGVARADHAQAGEVPGLAQELPAGDERLQDDVAQVGALVQDLAQGLGRHLVDLAVGPGDGARDGGAAGQLRHVAGELARPVDRDRLRCVAGLVHDLDLAGLDDEELIVPIADLEEFLSGLIPLASRRGAPRERRDLGLVEPREGHGLQIVGDHSVRGRGLTTGNENPNLIDEAERPDAPGTHCVDHGMPRVREVPLRMAIEGLLAAAYVAARAAAAKPVPRGGAGHAGLTDQRVGDLRPENRREAQVLAPMQALGPLHRPTDEPDVRALGGRRKETRMAPGILGNAACGLGSRGWILLAHATSSRV